MSTSTCNRTYISVDTHSGFKTLMLLSKPDRCNRRCDRKSLSNSRDDEITTTDKICSHAATKVVDDDKTLSLLVTIFALCSAPTDAPRGREGRGGPGGHSATDGHWSVGGRVLSSDQASGDDGVTRHRTGDGPFSTKKAWVRGPLNCLHNWNETETKQSKNSELFCFGQTKTLLPWNVLAVLASRYEPFARQASGWGGTITCAHTGVWLQKTAKRFKVVFLYVLGAAKQFWNCFISVSFQCYFSCADRIVNGHKRLTGATENAGVENAGAKSKGLQLRCSCHRQSWRTAYIGRRLSLCP